MVIPDLDRAGVGTHAISASVHNYAESIITIPGVTIEAFNGIIDSFAAQMGVPNWTGEYGFWDTTDATLDKVRRYAADEDRRGWGGTWWQWRQSCGDPHGVQYSGVQVLPDTGTSTHLNLLGCPDNEDLGANDAFLEILGRGYPRAVPGRLVELTSDPDTDLFAMKATATAGGGTLVVWTPSSDDADHHVHTSGLSEVVARAVPGGRVITATVTRPGDYTLRIGEPPNPASTSPMTSTPPAQPVSGTPGLTG